MDRKSHELSSWADKWEIRERIATGNTKKVVKRIQGSAIAKIKGESTNGWEIRIARRVQYGASDANFWVSIFPANLWTGDNGRTDEFWDRDLNVDDGYWARAK